MFPSRQKVPDGYHVSSPSRDPHAAGVRSGKRCVRLCVIFGALAVAGVIDVLDHSATAGIYLQALGWSVIPLLITLF